MKEFIHYITQSLLNEPKNIKLNETHTNDEYKLEVNIPPNEIGKIIGKHGIMADSLRTIGQLYSSKIFKKNMNFRITEHS